MQEEIGLIAKLDEVVAQRDNARSELHAHKEYNARLLIDVERLRGERDMARRQRGAALEVIRLMFMDEAT